MVTASVRSWEVSRIVRVGLCRLVAMPPVVLELGKFVAQQYRSEQSVASPKDSVYVSWCWQTTAPAPYI